MARGVRGDAGDKASPSSGSISRLGERGPHVLDPPPQTAGIQVRSIRVRSTSLRTVAEQVRLRCEWC